MILFVPMVVIIFTVCQDSYWFVDKDDTLIPSDSVNEVIMEHTESLDRVFAEFVNEQGSVDYDALRENPSNLDLFIEFLKKVSPENYPKKFVTEDDAKAYWINAYNALVMMTIVENPGITSVKDLGWGMGLFWRKKFLVGSRWMTLNHIEHQVLRKRFSDPRIHFAINCGSNSCPPLVQRIFSGADLDKRLEEKAVQFINDLGNVTVDRKKRIVSLSRIFKWYKKDFEAVSESVLHYVFQYLDGFSGSEKREIINSYQVQYFNYDWSLNSVNGR